MRGKLKQGFTMVEHRLFGISKAAAPEQRSPEHSQSPKHAVHTRAGRSTPTCSGTARGVVAPAAGRQRARALPPGHERDRAAGETPSSLAFYGMGTARCFTCQLL